MMTVVPTVSPAVSTLRRPVALFLVAGVLVFGLPLLVSCRLDQLLSPGRFAGLRIQPDTVGVADTVRLRVNMTAPLVFSSNDTTIATVTQSGVVSGVKRGKAAITARVTGVPGVDRPSSTTDTVWVVAVSVTLDHSDTTLTSVGDPVCYVATARDKYNVSLGAPDTIAILSDPDTALTADTTRGCYLARKSGRPATIEARVDTARARAAITVRQTVTSVQLSQSNVRLRSLAETTTISADARDARGNSVPAALLTWTSTDPIVATVDTAGQVTAKRNGQSRIVASNSGLADTATVTVLQDAKRVQFTLTPISRVNGSETVVPVARDGNDSIIPAAAAQFNWISDSAAVATARTLPNGNGVLDAQREGRTRISVSASAGDSSAAASDTLTVQFAYFSVTVSPDSAVLTSLGDTTPLTAVARDSDLTVVPQPQITWTSRDQNAVAVDTAGRAVARGAQARVFVVAVGRGGVKDSALAVVRQRAVRLVPVPSMLRLTSLTATRQLSDSAFDARDSLIATHTTTWTSDNAAVATVSSGGLVTAVANGSTKIRGTLDAAAESVTVDVVQAAKTVAVRPTLYTLRTLNAQVTDTAVVRDSLGQLIGNPGVVWQSLATSVAQVVSTSGNTATVRAVSEGTATIDARSGAGGGSGDGTAQVVVRFKLNALIVAPANPKFNHLGDTLTFTASGTDSLSNTITNPQVTWISRTPARLTINPTTGLATAVDTGDVWVVATHDNAVDSSLAQVRPPVLVADQTLFFADSLLLGTSQADTAYRHVSNVGTFTLGVKARIAHSASWLAITPDTLNLAATALDSIRLVARATGLVEGLYTDTVALTSVGAKNSPERIPVVVRVVCPTAAVAPDTSLAGSFAPGDCRSPQRPRSFADLYRFTGSLGDTVNIFLTTGAQTDLDTYLYLLNAAGDTIRSNDDCPGLGRNSCITQFRLPAAGQYRIEATTFDSAQFAYAVTLTHPVAPTGATALAQRTTSGAAIPPHDSTNNTTVVLAATGHDGNGRDSLRIQVEVRPVATSFTGTPTDTGSAVPNATPGVPLSVTVANLQTDTWYRWRARVVDQTGRVGPWTQFLPDSAFKVVTTGAVLTVTPGSVNATALATGSSVAETLSVSNTSTGNFTWSATKVLGGAWLSLAPSTPGQPQNTSLILTLSPAGLTAGTYTDTVLVDAGVIAGSPTKIPVTFTVQQPVLIVTPDSVVHSGNAGSSAIFVDTVRISRGGTGSLTWTATKASAWLHLSKTAGGAPDQIIDTIFVGGRPAGTYRDTIRINSSEAGTTKLVPVILRLQQPVLVVTPDSVADSANVGSVVARTDTIHIANGDGGTMSWTAVKVLNRPWFSLSASAGTGAADLVLTLHPDTLSTGTKTDTVVISSPDVNNGPIKVSVTFRIRQPVLSVTPSSLSDNAQQGDTAKKTKTLNVTNTGGGTLPWSVTTDTTWLNVTPSGGTGAGSITVTLNPAGLATGTHTGHVTVTSAGATGSPAQITVTFTITPPPQLAVTPSARTDTAFLGSSAPKTSFIRVSNAGGGTLSWLATKDSSWIGLTNPSGTAPPTDSATLSQSPNGLATGTHTGHVVINAGAIAGSPSTVTTTFVIVPCAVNSVTPDALVSASLTTADCGAPHRAGSFAKVYSVSASTDTIDVTLSATFDAYLVVTDGAGSVITSNDTCPGSTGTACVRNVPVPANGVRIEATTAVASATGTFSLSVTKPQPPASPTPNQFKADGSTPIAVGDTTNQSTVVFRSTVTDPNVRDSLRLQVELRFAGANNFTMVATDSSAAVAPGAVATITRTGLADDTTYHWRARTCDQTGRCSAWFDFAGNAVTAPDFRVAVPEKPFAPVTLRQSYSGGPDINVGGTDTTTTIVLSATVSDPDPGDQLRLQVERRTAGSTFLNTPTATASSAVASGQVSTVTLTGQTDNTGYRWQVRTIDQRGDTSSWVDFGANSVLADYQIDLPKAPNLPDNLAQFQSDGTTPIAVGGHTGGIALTVTVVLRGRVTDPNAGDMDSLEVEVTGPLGTYTGAGAAVASGGNSSATVSVPAGAPLAAFSYYWRARACDRTGRCGGWAMFGNNAPTATDFLAP